MIFEFFIDGIASFLGGYFSQKTIEKKISIKKFFLIVFFILLSVSFAYQISVSKISLEHIGFGLLVSFLGASFCSLVLYVRSKIKK
jgi:hypothetical protein